MTLQRPADGEHDAYYATYVDKVPDGPILGTLEGQLPETLALLKSFSEEDGGYRYQPEKWSVKEVVGHVVDVERLFQLRALWFVRRAAHPLPGMEQDDWVRAAQFDRRSLAELIRELESVRPATLSLFAAMTEEEGRRRGVASGFEFTVRSIPWIIAGHEIHHRGVLESRYRR